MSSVFRRTGGLALVVLVAIAISACVSSTAVPDAPATGGVQEITAEDLRSMLDDKDFTLINVHIPFEGEIAGTDVHVPYNEIEEHADQLPQDKDAKIVLYCRSGSMSASASKTLTKMGYTNVIDVSGGMNAWRVAGYEVLDSPSDAR